MERSVYLGNLNNSNRGNMLYSFARFSKVLLNLIRLSFIAIANIINHHLPIKYINYSNLDKRLYKSIEIDGRKILFFSNLRLFSSNEVGVPTSNKTILDFYNFYSNSFTDGLSRFANRIRTLALSYNKNIDRELVIENSFVIFSSGLNNHSHYLIDLSRIYYAKKIGVKKIFIAMQNNNKLEQYLENFTEFEIIYYNNTYNYSLKNVYLNLEYLEDINSNFDCERFKWFTERLKKGLNENSLDHKTNKSYIYLPRKSNKYRNILNLAEFESVLSNYGYYELDLNKYDLYDQFRLLSNAKVIIGPHGANLTSAILSSNALVIDITNKWWLRDKFHSNLFSCLDINLIEIVDIKNRLYDRIFANQDELINILDSL
jgi:hypothetical protein